MSFSGTIDDRRLPIAGSAQPEIGQPRPEILPGCCPTPATEHVPWLRLTIGLFIAAQTMLFGLAVSLTPPEEPTTRLLLHGAMAAATGLVVVLLGWPLLVEAVRELVHRRVTMELLFLAGIAGAGGASVQSMVTGEGPVYFDVVSILLIVYSIGRAINLHSRRKAMSVIRSVTRGIETARRVGRIVAVGEIVPGDLVQVMPGELIPVDGRIVRGEGLVRRTPFTGESISTVRRAGDEVLAGMGCEDASLVIEATAAGCDRRVDKLAGLIDAARQSPTSLQRQADLLVKWFLPAVMVVAGGAFWYWSEAVDWHRGLFVALSILLIACPCAAGLATPLALWTALGRLGERGLIVRSGDAIERLAAVDEVVFDKTGTLSDERLVVRDVEVAPGSAAGFERGWVLGVVRAVERCCSHPVARALAELEVPEDAPSIEVLEVRTLPGRGVEAVVATAGWASATTPKDGGLSPPCATFVVRIVRDEEATGAGELVVRVVLDGLEAGRIVLEERLRDGAEETVGQLREMGLGVRVMTGDGAGGAARVARLVETQWGMTPEEKLEEVRGGNSSGGTRPAALASLGLRSGLNGGRRTLYVGDGLNDAAAMAASHVSIALASGAATAVETASATLHGGNLRLIPEAVGLSRRAVGVVRSNLHWAVGYNIVGIAVAAMGWLNPVLAALLMAVSSAVVAWRSFHRVQGSGFGVQEEKERERDRGTRRQGDKGTSRQGDGAVALGGNRSTFALSACLVWLSLVLGLVGQGVVLGVLAGVGWSWTGVIVVLSGLGAWGLVRWRARFPVWSDHIVGMVSLGGLGMNLGWWMDVGFLPAVRDGVVLTCCAASDAGLLGSSYWMYVGMLLLGMPGMYLLRRAPEVFDWRKWCCIGPLVLGVPGMCAGMWAGAMLSAHLHAGLPPGAQVIMAYGWMMAGMVAGMMVPHALHPSSLRETAVPQQPTNRRLPAG
jgi:heavy metal translocating P-type ATPase